MVAKKFCEKHICNVVTLASLNKGRVFYKKNNLNLANVKFILATLFVYATKNIKNGLNSSHML